MAILHSPSSILDALCMELSRLSLEKFRQFLARLRRPHERFTDQKNMNAPRLDASNLVDAVNAAFANRRHARRDQRRQFFRGREIDVERLQIPIVDAQELELRPRF
jgi:hypothetical protein